MAGQYEAGKVEIPARIYPGIFPGEVQATVVINNQDIHLIVSSESVRHEQEIVTKGIDGVLIAEIVSKTNDGYLINLPGEVQGATNRVEYAVT